MTNLYLDRRDLSIEERSGALIVRDGENHLRSLPLSLIDNIVIGANVQCRSNTLLRCAAAGTGVVFLDCRDPDRSVTLEAAGGPNSRRRAEQMRAALDEEFCRRFSRRLVETKIQFSVGLLREAAETRPDQRYEIFKGCSRLDSALVRVRSGSPLDRAALMGVEGAAAAAHFEAYGRLFAGALGFNGRNRRPPRDPVNACLSLGYTLVHAEAVRAAIGCGLDPAVGFYHELAHGRESLACDLVETARPDVERWVWLAFRDRLLRPEHFRTLTGACLMGKTGRRVFYEQFETVRLRATERFRRRCQHLTRLLHRFFGIDR
jgi:CRISP-associated protein Cas1